MPAKILLADDSSTIQKVIKITLANSGYDIEICESEEELLSKIEELQPALTLLDFNLSEDKTGYELAKAIKIAHPAGSILLMFGTFDSIDESLITESGVADKIVKPFDSSRFIGLCQSLIDQAGSSTSKFEEESEEVDNIVEMSHSKREIEAHKSLPEEKPEISIEEPMVLKDVSSDELESWDDISVPGVIGNVEISNNVLEDIPPVIEEVVIDDIAPISPTGEVASLLPSDEDLAYPDMDDLWTDSSSETEPQAPAENAKPSKPKSQLVSLDQLAPLDDESESVNHMYDSPELDAVRSDEELEELENEIAKDNDSHGLWSADGSNSKEQSDMIADIPLVVEEDVVDYMDHGDFEKSSDVVEEIKVDLSIEDELRQSALNDDDMEKQIRIIVEEVVKKYCRESIEKVAWEVIPDLAENLIRKELHSISESIIQD